MTVEQFTIKNERENKIKYPRMVPLKQGLIAFVYY